MIPLTEHREGTCRAIVDYENGELARAMMCGAPTTFKLDGTRSSWCKHHHGLHCFKYGTPAPQINSDRLRELGVNVIVKKSKSKATSPGSPWHGRTAASKPKPPPPEMRQCNVCHWVKPLTHFDRDGDRRRTYCKACRSTASKPKGPQLPAYDQSKFVPLSEVASKYGFPRGTVYTWECRGVLPITKIGSRRFAMITDVEFLAATRSSSA